MKWSVIIGNFWGTEIRLHASMLLLIPYALIAFEPDSLSGAMRVLLLITAIFVFVALHEMGHTLAARLYGIQVKSIILWPLGGFANLSRRPDKVLPDLVISAAGPLTNLLIAGMLGILTLADWLIESASLPLGLSRFLDSAGVFPFLISLTVANLSLAIFNLVPIYPLDGGQIAHGVLKLIFGEKLADLLMMFVSLPLALGLTMLGFFTRDIVVVLTGLLLLLAGASLNTKLFNAMTLGMLYFIDRGGYYLKRGDLDPAIHHYNQAIHRSPNRAGLYVSRAVVYMNLNECELAMADIDRSLALDPHSFIAWALRGELLSLEKAYPPALEAYNHAITIRPTWSMTYIDRGSLYLEMGDLPRALADLNHSIELGHGSPVAYVMRSILRYQMRDLNGSRADADQALRYAPQYMLVFPETFLVSLQGYLNWALDYYWRAIERMPGAYQSFQGRGDACRVNNHPDWAIADYDRAIKLAPRQGELYLTRGKAYLALADNTRAIADFRQAVQRADKAHIRRQAETLLHLYVSAPPMPPTDGAAAAWTAPNPPQEQSAETSAAQPSGDSKPPE